MIVWQGVFIFCMTKKRTKKVTKKSPDIVLLAAPTNPLPIHIRWFFRDHLPGFSGLCGCSLNKVYPSGLWICEPPTYAKDSSAEASRVGMASVAIAPGKPGAGAF